MSISTEKEQNPLMRILHYLGYVLTYPFKRDFTFFCVICVFALLVNVIAWILLEDFMSIAYQGLKAYTLVYILTVVPALLPKYLIYIYKSIIFLYGVINTVTDYVCYYTMHIGYSNDVIDIIRGTNKSEIKEFLQVWFDWTSVVFGGGIFLLVCLAYHFREIINFVGRKTWAFYFIPLLLHLYMMVYKTMPPWDTTFIIRAYHFLQYEAPPKPLKKELKIAFTENSLPKKLILIIGESFSKSHSSLYGYEKNTNPQLEKLRSEGNLMVYTDVTAAGIHTVAAFENFMTNVATSDSGKEWNECNNIINLMSGLHYRTIWISNQSPSGMYDNIPASFAALCDTCFFAGNRFIGIGKSNVKGNYDENVLEVFEKNPSNKERKECYIFHLMGSHEVFKYRYPAHFEKFIPEDYPNRIEEQRQLLAEYDNSILYNDEVVSRIIRLFEKEDALALYFSDHALDLFESSDDYCGHARWGEVESQKVAVRIPYMIYISPMLKERNLELAKQIEDEKDEPFNANQLYDKLIDLLDVSAEGDR